MEHSNKLNVMLIGDNIETRIALKNALSKLNTPCHIGDYFCLDKAVANPAKVASDRPDIIFLDTNRSAQECSNEVRKIRNDDQFRDCSLVVYDSNAYLRNTNEIFSEGANFFINQPYDFPRLKKVMANLIGMNRNQNHFSNSANGIFL